MVCVSEDQGSNWGRSRSLQRGLAQVLKRGKEAWKTAGIFHERQQGQGHGQWEGSEEACTVLLRWPRAEQEIYRRQNSPGDTVLNITDFASALRAWQWRPLQEFENGPAYPDYFHLKGSEH